MWFLSVSHIPVLHSLLIVVVLLVYEFSLRPPMCISRFSAHAWLQWLESLLTIVWDSHAVLSVWLTHVHLQILQWLMLGTIYNETCGLLVHNLNLSTKYIYCQRLDQLFEIEKNQHSLIRKTNSILFCYELEYTVYCDTTSISQTYQVAQIYAGYIYNLVILIYFSYLKDIIQYYEIFLTLQSIWSTFYYFLS